MVYLGRVIPPASTDFEVAAGQQTSDQSASQHVS